VRTLPRPLGMILRQTHPQSSHRKHSLIDVNSVVSGRVT
jgi:hypothetical protein